MSAPNEEELAFLLDFNGARYLFNEGYWVKFEVRRVEPTPQRPHGLYYSFTLHDPDGERLLGFDNAHGVGPLGGRFAAKPAEHDHWHRTGDDPGRPYVFRSAFELVEDFFAEVDRVLGERGVSAVMVASKGESDV